MLKLTVPAPANVPKLLLAAKQVCNPGLHLCHSSAVQLVVIDHKTYEDHAAKVAIDEETMSRCEIRHSYRGPEGPGNGMTASQSSRTLYKSIQAACTTYLLVPRESTQSQYASIYMPCLLKHVRTACVSCVQA